MQTMEKLISISSLYFSTHISGLSVVVFLLHEWKVGMQDIYP